MKKLFTALLTFAAAAPLMAQTYTTSPADTIWSTVVPVNNNLVDGYITLNPVGSQQVRLVWSIPTIETPAGWQWAVCDNVTCYSDVTTAEPVHTMNPFNSASSVTYFKVETKPNNIPGTGRLVLRVWNYGDSLNAKFLEFNVSALVNRDEPAWAAGLQVSPVPAQDQLVLRQDGGLLPAATLTLTNVQGQTLRTLETGAAAEASLAVADLARGMYFLHIRTAEGEVVRRVVLD